MHTSLRIQQFSLNSMMFWELTQPSQRIQCCWFKAGSLRVPSKISPPTIWHMVGIQLLHKRQMEETFLMALILTLKHGWHPYSQISKDQWLSLNLDFMLGLLPQTMFQAIVWTMVKLTLINWFQSGMALTTLWLLNNQMVQFLMLTQCFSTLFQMVFNSRLIKKKTQYQSTMIVP